MEEEKKEQESTQDVKKQHSRVVEHVSFGIQYIDFREVLSFLMNFATKQYLRETEQRLNGNLEKTEKRLDEKIDKVEKGLNEKISLVRSDLEKTETRLKENIIETDCKTREYIDKRPSILYNKMLIFLSSGVISILVSIWVSVWIRR